MNEVIVSLTYKAFRIGLAFTGLFLFAAHTALQAEPVKKADIPDSFPRFTVPGDEVQMTRLRELFFLHYRSDLASTMWDAWIPMSILWSAPAVDDSVATACRKTLQSRRIDSEGYVSCHQHEGLGHSEGWPFPLWTQVEGIGFHFNLSGMPFGSEYGVHLTETTKDWTLEGADDNGIDSETGWKLHLSGEKNVITTPPFAVQSIVTPFVRMEWKAAGMPQTATAYMEWTSSEHPTFARERRIYFSPVGGEMTATMLPVYRLAQWGGTLTRMRFCFENADGSDIVIKSVITAVDTRHAVNNAAYIRGCIDYVRWTGDINFLRQNIARMRTALAFAIKEFRLQEEGCAVIPWVGHDGRSGLVFDKDGKKTIRHGFGIGNNYWDLIPFGGKDALDSIYYYDALKQMAQLEQAVTAHPEWSIQGYTEYSARTLASIADRMKDYGGKAFWNKKTDRFIAAIDAEGNRHDYGFTFVNLEAIYYGFATPRQASRILDWLDGKRIIKGDTSTGEDIYHWQFAPRATTLRNLDYYQCVWYLPESIIWGNQVQDGGAVLGFSYHDLMARLRIAGPDNAWKRLSAILDWFGQVQAAGGYREYYKDPSRGTLQGNMTAGGLGMDSEFIESVLVPQVMLYGFMGMEPRFDGFTIRPTLPTSWPHLTITPVRIQDQSLTITATADTVTIGQITPSIRPLAVYPAPGVWTATYSCGDTTLLTKSYTIKDSASTGIPLGCQTNDTLVLTKAHP